MTTPHLSYSFIWSYWMVPECVPILRRLRRNGTTVEYKRSRVVLFSCSCCLHRDALVCFRSLLFHLFLTWSEDRPGSSCEICAHLLPTRLCSWIKMLSSARVQNGACNTETSSFPCPDFFIFRYLFLTWSEDRPGSCSEICFHLFPIRLCSWVKMLSSASVQHGVFTTEDSG